MCSRYMLVSPAGLLAKATGMKVFPLVNPRYNAAPTQMLPVVRRAGTGDDREVAVMRWGLVPAWSRVGRMQSVLVNARAETAARKPAFREAFRHRRCLVPADGFFEWKREGRDRLPWLFEPCDGVPFCFAGLWESWAGPGAEPFESFTILTTTPNSVVAGFHDRMPVILPPGTHDAWLHAEPGATDPGRLLTPCPAETIRARPVNPRVNSVANDDPACIEPPPVGAAPGGQLTLDLG